jgi:LysR family hydrogen peroxide-inducible transcriptional activator
VIHDRFPKLELLLSEEKTEVVIDRLRDGGLDAGILALPIRGDGLVIEPLFDEDFVLVVPASHRLATTPGETVDLDVLANERMLLLEEGHCLRDHALAVCDLAGATERRGFRATTLETLRHMVAAGVGMTLLPALALRAPVTPSPSVMVRRFTPPAPSRRIALCWRRSSAHRDLLPRLADVVRNCVAAQDLPVTSIDAPVSGGGPPSDR